MGILKVAKSLGIRTGMVQRIANELDVHLILDAVARRERDRRRAALP
jgi:hypothetical protein